MSKKSPVHIGKRTRFANRQSSRTHHYAQTNPMKRRLLGRLRLISERFLEELRKSHSKILSCGTLHEGRSFGSLYYEFDLEISTFTAVSNSTDGEFCRFDRYNRNKRNSTK